MHHLFFFLLFSFSFDLAPVRTINMLTRMRKRVVLRLRLILHYPCNKASPQSRSLPLPSKLCPMNRLKTRTKRLHTRTYTQFSPSLFQIDQSDQTLSRRKQQDEGRKRYIDTTTTTIATTSTTCLSKSLM